MSTPREPFDVLIIGGGPAGLSAALVLGRACRSVLLSDGPPARNAVTTAVHGFLSRDGTPPAELRRIGRVQLAPYDVEVRESAVASIARGRRGEPFAVTFEDGSDAFARRLLLATGMMDHLPQIDGFSEVYGTSAHHCPYCDGWEWRDRAIAVYAPANGLPYAHTMRAWSSNVTLLTHGARVPSEREAARLFGSIGGVAVIGAPIRRLVSSGGQIQQVEFDGGREPLRCEAFFFHLGMDQASDLPARLRCRMQGPFVWVGPDGMTSVPGVYAAGDLTPGAQSVALAVAEGSVVAASMHQSLWDEETR